MKIEVVTPDSDGNRGGFGARVHMLLLMLSQFAEVHCVLTSWPEHPDVEGVTFAFSPIAENGLTRVGLLRNFYSSEAPQRPAWPRPDVLLIENLDLLAARRNLPSVPVVLDEHNIYWELLQYDLLNRPFFQSGAGAHRSVQRFLRPWLLMRATHFEERAIQEARGVLVTSQKDRDKLLARIPEAAPRIHVVPNCVDVRRYSPITPEDEASSVLFAGNFNYVPNREAAGVIAGILAPALPKTSFVLVGKDPPPSLPKYENLVVMGHVARLDPLLRKAGVCIAPLLHGSGTRIKILTYLSAGKAVVATTKACEGLELINGRHLLIRDDWEGFLSGIRQLLEDPAARQEMGRAGRQFVEQRYDWRVHVPALRHAFEEAR